MEVTATWRLIDSPIRCMQGTLSQPTRVLSAMLPVAINALVFAAMGAVVAVRTSEAIAGGQAAGPSVGMIAAIAGTGAVLSAAAGFGLHVGVVVVLDTLVSQSGRTRKLIELTGQAYWPQLIWSIPALTASVLMFNPEPFWLPMDNQAAMSAYTESMSREPLQIVLDTTQRLFAVWLIALHACALKVIGGLTVGGAWGMGIILGGMFVGAPLALQSTVQNMLF